MDFFEMMADMFTFAEELMNSAATWGYRIPQGCDFDFIS
jgi:hypothetical protein